MFGGCCSNSLPFLSSSSESVSILIIFVVRFFFAASFALLCAALDLLGIVLETVDDCDGLDLDDFDVPLFFSFWRFLLAV